MVASANIGSDAVPLLSIMTLDGGRQSCVLFLCPFLWLLGLFSAGNRPRSLAVRLRQLVGGGAVSRRDPVRLYRFYHVSTEYY